MSDNQPPKKATKKSTKKATASAVATASAMDDVLRAAGVLPPKNEPAPVPVKVQAPPPPADDGLPHCYFKLEEPKLFAAAFDVFETIIEGKAKITPEGMIFMDPAGLHIWQYDGSHTMYIMLDCPANSFDEFNVSHEYNFNIAFSDFNKVTKKRESGEYLVFEYLPVERRAKIEFGKPGKKSKKIYKIATYIKEDPEDEEGVPIGDQKMTVPYILETNGPSADFVSMVKSAALFGERVELTIHDNKLVWQNLVSAGSMYIEQDKDDFSQYIIAPSDPDFPGLSAGGPTEFAVKQLEKIAKLSELSDNLKMYLARDIPMHLAVNFGHDCRMEVFVGPYVDKNTNTDTTPNAPPPKITPEAGSQ